MNKIGCFISLLGILSGIGACSSGGAGGSDSGSPSSSSSSGGSAAPSSSGGDHDAEAGAMAPPEPGGGAGSGNACTLKLSGTVVQCLDWENLTAQEISGLCHVAQSTAQETYALVASCPTANIVGICSINMSAGPGGAAAYSYRQIFYVSSENPCSIVKQICENYGSSSIATETFDGGC
jgi:hypothetical protein